MRQSVLLNVRALHERFQDGLPLLDPVEDMKIDAPRLRSIVREIEDLEARLAENTVHKTNLQQNERVEEFDRKVLTIPRYMAAP